VEQTQLQYNAMHVGIFELLRTKQDEVRAGVEYVDALRDYWVARAKLERAAGGALPSGIATTQPTTAPGPPTSAPATANPHEGHHH
jgi:cobalt-zinc-cadmium efflux system outer membrane protein